ncbi:hypothetical protein DFH09DRAFT_1336679 [Mycena vulgaris]|nr:hypothetical protein DFH09DRAFT_1336679 [Mycena vulgaris]
MAAPMYCAQIKSVVAEAIFPSPFYHTAEVFQSAPCDLETPKERAASSNNDTNGVVYATTTTPLATVHFDPRLAIQRRFAILNILRKECVQSVLDAGCGNGVLLDFLFSQALQRTTNIPSGLITNPYQTSEAKLTDTRLPLRRLGGIDVHLPSLMRASRSLALVAADSAAQHAADAATTPFDLQIDLWHGSLLRPVAELANFEAVVVSEVIEHLNEADFTIFGRIIFSVYRPRLVIVTTPNFSFNPYFDPPVDDMEKKTTRFPDPTGRTQRIFRHHDHQFEFTEAEFREWAHSIGAAFGYSVEFGGVGSLPAYPTRRTRAEISQPPHPDKFFATQFAIFRLDTNSKLKYHDSVPDKTPVRIASTRYIVE